MGKFEPIGDVQPFLKLQEGIWADVFKAYDASLERNVLLKKLKPEYNSDVAIADRFEAEARLMAQVQHPNVVSVLSFGKSDQGTYFIAEFIEGITLDAWLAQGRLPDELAAFILRQAAAGLSAAHDQQILHRDIKPANILVSAAGEVKLADFGMASLSELHADHELRGTLGYFAPELVFEGAPTHATDLFALGATFYNMLAGQPAFPGATPADVFDQVLHHDPTTFLEANTQIHPALVRICRALLEKDPEHRYKDARRLIEELDRWLSRFPTFNGEEALAGYLAAPADYWPPESDLQEPAGAVEPMVVPPPRSRVVRTTTIFSGLALVLVVTIIWIANVGRISEVEPSESLAASDSVALSIVRDEDSTYTERPMAVPSEAGLPDIEEQTEGASAVVADVEPPPAPNAVRDSTVDDADATAVVQEELLAQRAVLSVLCNPYCDVLLDGEPAGVAPPPLDLEVTPGVHTISMLHPELPAYHQDVYIEAGETDTLLVPLLDQVGTVTIKVLPWAEMYIDGVHHGTNPPMQSLFLTPGEHNLTLVHPELGTVSSTLIVAAGDEQTHSFNLNNQPGE